MALIKVDADALRTQAAAVETKISELNGMNGRLLALIQRIGDSWQGQASTAYARVMFGYLQQAQDMIQLLEEFKKYAENAAREFEAEDKQGAQRIRGSF